MFKGIKPKEQEFSSSLLLMLLYRYFILDFIAISFKEAFEELVQHFTKFDEQFEYGSKIPQMFLRYGHHKQNSVGSLQVLGNGSLFIMMHNC